MWRTSCWNKQWKDFLLIAFICTYLIIFRAARSVEGYSSNPRVRTLHRFNSLTLLHFGGIFKTVVVVRSSMWILQGVPYHLKNESSFNYRPNSRTHGEKGILGKHLSYFLLHIRCEQENPISAQNWTPTAKKAFRSKHLKAIIPVGQSCILPQYTLSLTFLTFSVCELRGFRLKRLNYIY